MKDDGYNIRIKYIPIAKKDNTSTITLRSILKT